MFRFKRNGRFVNIDDNEGSYSFLIGLFFLKIVFRLNKGITRFKFDRGIRVHSETPRHEIVRMRRKDDKVDIEFTDCSNDLFVIQKF